MEVCDSALAKLDVMCHVYVSLQLMSIPRTNRVSANGMFLPSSVKAGQSRAGSRWRCWDFKWLIWSCQSLHHFWIYINAIWSKYGVRLSKDVYSFKLLANILIDASPANSITRSLINKIKRIGSRTEPWDPLQITAEDWGKTRSTANCCDPFVRKADVHNVRHEVSLACTTESNDFGGCRMFCDEGMLMR